MPTLVIHSTTADGFVDSQDVGEPASYASARAGTGSNPLTATTAFGLQVGQAYEFIDPTDTFLCDEAFVSFDTTGLLTAEDTVTDPVLSLYPNSDSSATDFTIQARAKDFGAAVTTADWVAGASLSALPLLATYDTSGGFSGAAYKDFTSEAGFAAAVVKNGVTYLLLCSSRHVAGTEPTGNEYVSAKAADAAGTTQDPKLTITYTAAPTNAAPVFDQNLGNRTSAEGDVISLSAAATDADDDPITYSATGLPTGLSINASTGLISGTIGADAAGSYSVEVNATDGTDPATPDSFTWTVTAAVNPTTAMKHWRAH